MNWFELTIETTSEATEAIGGVLVSLGINGWATVDSKDLQDFATAQKGLWDYIDEALIKSYTDSVFIKVYLPDNQQGNETVIALKSALNQLKAAEKEINLGSLALKMNNVNEADWANNWKKYFKPIEIGKKLTIRPEWEEYNNKAGRTVLTIDPGSAFGTGSHATTKLCLEFLDELVKPGDEVLDVGTGSGILAVAAVLLGAEKAIGVDIDENSVNVAQQTAKLNNAEGKTAFYQRDLVTGVTGQYDIITANIVADIILRLAPSVPGLLKSSGVFISSGIIDDRLADVKQGLIDAGFKVLQVKEQDGWAAIAAALDK